MLICFKWCKHTWVHATSSRDVSLLPPVDGPRSLAFPHALAFLRSQSQKLPWALFRRSISIHIRRSNHKRAALSVSVNATATRNEDALLRPHSEVVWAKYGHILWAVWTSWATSSCSLQFLKDLRIFSTNCYYLCRPTKIITLITIYWFSVFLFTISND